MADTVSSSFSQAFVFLTKLAWNSRITLPALLTIVFMSMDFRMQMEISVQSEHITIEEGGDLNESYSDTDSWQTIDDDAEAEDDDEYYEDEDDIDDDDDDDDNDDSD